MSDWYEVPLYEGNELVIYEVEADSEEEALERAAAERDSITRAQFERENTRESLTQEKAAAQRGLMLADEAEAVAPGLGLAQGLAYIPAGVTEQVLNMGQGITDALAGMGPDPFGMSAGAKQASQKLRDMRAGNKRVVTRINSAAQEWANGAPLTEEQRLQAAEETETFVKRGKFATDAALGMVGGAATLAAKTLPRMVGMGAVEGSLGGWLMADADERSTIEESIDTRSLTATIGGVLGGGLSILPGVFAAAKNLLGRKIAKAGGGAANNQSARAELRSLGIHDADPAQITGDPKLARIVAESAGKTAQDMFNRQAEAAVHGMGSLIGLRLPPIAELLSGGSKKIKNIMKMSERALGKMKQKRNKQFQDGLEQVEDLTDNRPIFNPHDTIVRVNQELAEIAREYGDTPFSPVFKHVVKILNEAKDNGGLTAKQMNTVLTRLRAIQRTGSGLFDGTHPEIAAMKGTMDQHSKIIAKNIRLTLEESFDSLDQTTPAGKLLNQLRGEYGRRTDEIMDMEAAFKESVGAGGTPAQILKRLETADDAVVKEWADGLRQIEGGELLLADLHKQLFRQAVAEATQEMVDKGARLGDFDLATFVKALGKTAESSKLKGLMTADQERYLAHGLKTLRLLLNTNRDVRAGFIPLDLQHLAINLVSRDPGFVARLIGAAVQKGEGAEALFFTQKGQEFLFDAVNKVLKAEKTGAAIQGGNAIVGNLLAMIGAKGQMNEAARLGWATEDDENMEQQ